MSGWSRPTEVAVDSSGALFRSGFASLALFLRAGFAARIGAQRAIFGTGQNRSNAAGFALGLGGDRAAEAWPGSLASGRFIKCSVEGIGEPRDHLGRNALGRKTGPAQTLIS